MTIRVRLAFSIGIYSILLINSELCNSLIMGGSNEYVLFNKS
jgi:hypothetical protein